MGNPARHVSRLAGRRPDTRGGETLVCAPDTAHRRTSRTGDRRRAGRLCDGREPGCARLAGESAGASHALAQEASGNPQGVLYLKLSAHGTALSQLIVSGFGYTRRLLEHLQRGVDWDDCGVLQLAFNAKEAERQAQLAAAFPEGLLHSLDQVQAEARAGIALPAGGLFYPEGGWVHPPALCQWQAGQSNIELLTHHDVLELRRVDGDWQAWDGDRLLAQAPTVVLAGAAEIKRFTYSSGLPLKRIRGQITRLPQTLQARR